MNGAHDLGGRHGFGPVDRSQTEDFVHSWEETVFGLTLTCGMLGQWNLDQSRFARESTDHVHYLSSTYYEHWLHGLELLLLQNGLITEQELTSGAATVKPKLQAATPERVAEILKTGAPTSLPEQAANRFTLNQTVVVKSESPKSHTRVPSYIKGVRGKITQLHGAHIYADEHARSGSKVPEHLYSVRFEGTDIWGNQAEPSSCVYVDLFEPHLLTLEEHRQEFTD